VASLALVAFEVRQANVLAKAQTESSMYEGWENLSIAEIETGINDTYKKSLENPSRLSTSELADISSWLIAVISLYQRNGRMYHEYGLTTDPGYSDVGRFYFTGEVTRDWYEDNESWIRQATSRLADAIREYIESTPPISINPSPEYASSRPSN